MTFIPFDPKKHKTLDLFEAICKKLGNKVEFQFRPSTASFEQAQKAPWFYFVEESEKSSST